MKGKRALGCVVLGLLLLLSFAQAAEENPVVQPIVGLRRDIRYFGLTFTAVGPDTENDMFGHIGQDELAKAILSGTEDIDGPKPDPKEQ